MKKITENKKLRAINGGDRCPLCGMEIGKCSITWNLHVERCAASFATRGNPNCNVM